MIAATEITGLPPPGGIFLWVKLPDQVDTMKLYRSALAAGIVIDPDPMVTDATPARAAAVFRKFD